MHKIAVLGCCGYIGSQLTRTLIQIGYNVVGIDSLRYFQLQPSIDNRFKFYHDDITTFNLDKIADCDLVINLAAVVGEAACNQKPFEAREVNHNAVKRLVDAFPDKRTLFPNSNSAYGNSKFSCNEESPVHPLSLYAETKLAAERYITDVAENYVVLRLATVYGISPRFRLDLLVNNFVYKAVYDKRIELFEGHFIRNSVSIFDVVNCIVFCISNWNKVKNQIYNVAHPRENISKLELCKVIQEFTPYKIVDGDGKDNDQRNAAIDSSKLLKTGFEYYDSLRNQIPKLISFYKTFATKEPYKTLDKLKMTNYWII